MGSVPLIGRPGDRRPRGLVNGRSADHRRQPRAPRCAGAGGAFRRRDGTDEHYVHDVLADLRGYLLRPPQMLPSLHGRYYALTSLTLPEPEYLYLYGLVLLYSAMAAGNWPRGTRVGGREEDFAASRNLLVDDLHADVGLPGTTRSSARCRGGWCSRPTAGT
jgi:hypothetical protein